MLFRSFARRGHSLINHCHAPFHATVTTSPTGNPPDREFGRFMRRANTPPFSFLPGNHTPRAAANVWASFPVETHIRLQHYKNAPQRPEQMKRCMILPSGEPVTGSGTARPRDPLSARATFPAMKLIQVNAAPRYRWSAWTQQRVITGGPMPICPQSAMRLVKAAGWRVLTGLTLCLFFLVSTYVTVQAMPENIPAQSVFAVATVDCTAADGGANRAHCPGTPYGTAVGSRFAEAFLPNLVSSGWCYAANTCGPVPTDQQLLRPPKLVPAHA